MMLSSRIYPKLGFLVRKLSDWLRTSDFSFAWALFRMLGVWVLYFVILIAFFFALFAVKPLLIAIPLVIQIACVFLGILTIVLLVSMLRERRRVLEACDKILAVLEPFKPATIDDKTYGLTFERIEQLRQRGKQLHGRPRDWWQALEESLQSYTSLNGRLGWFITQPVVQTMSEEEVISTYYHSTFHQAVPGVLTALGLLATFIAILMALSGVTYNVRDAIRPVTGIDQLINGLSGKFLSSIIALGLSVLFTFCEKKICERQILHKYSCLVRRCQEVFPFLSQARILLDIQRLAISQSGITRDAVMGVSISSD